MQNPLLGNRFSITWCEEGEIQKLFYYPPDQCFYSCGIDDEERTKELTARVACYCNATSEELSGYFRNAYELLQQFRGY